MAIAWFWVKKAWAILSAVFMLLAVTVDAVPTDTQGGMAYVSEERFVLEQALIRGQGITTDGEHYYFSGNFFLTKTTLDATEVVETNLLAIPPQLLLKGCNHIGGISYYDGKIYAAIEDGSDYLHPFIVTFDAETLAYIDIYPLEQELHVDGVPWVAVDGARGVLYTAEWSNAAVLNVYDLKTVTLLKTVPLSQKLDRIQGAEVYDGKLYLSSDNRQDGKKIFVTDPTTGKTDLFAERFVGADVEAEGMTVYPMADRTLFHVTDIGGTRTNASLRHYKPEDL